jgi:hypothetical protein
VSLNVLRASTALGLIGAVVALPGGNFREALAGQLGVRVNW